MIQKRSGLETASLDSLLILGDSQTRLPDLDPESYVSFKMYLTPLTLLATGLVPCTPVASGTGPSAGK